ncbi:MAG: hypothetical protein SO176_02900 [Bacilli bacterium]|nr:hypothetical protein [Bacilli bacterium]
MKYVDKGEFYRPKDENKAISEQAIFKAEQFLVSENKNPPLEIVPIQETSTSSSIQKNERSEGDNKDLLDKVKTTSSNSAHAVSESVAAASGATSSVVVTGAVIIISVGVGGAVFTNIGKYINREIGNNYSVIEVDIDKIIESEEKVSSLTSKDFSLLVYNDKNNEEKYEYEVRSGSQRYLFPNLNINTSYSYELISNSNTVDETTSYYKDSFKTTSEKNPKMILDEQNTYLVYSDDELSYSLSYSFYLSDYYQQVETPVLYVCSSEQQDYSSMNDVLFMNEMLDDQHFFKDQMMDLRSKHLYFYVLGEMNGEYSCLYSYYMETNCYEEEPPIIEEHEPLEIDGSSISPSFTPFSVSISGITTNYDDQYEFFAFFSTYSSDGAYLSEMIDAPITFIPHDDDSNYTFIINTEVEYGIASFTFNMGYINEENVNITTYSSEHIAYNENQDVYLASFDKKGIDETNITYKDDSVLIELKTNFTSDYDNYSYHVDLVDDNNQILSNYQGKGDAYFEIIGDQNLGNLRLIYQEVASFRDGEHILATYETDRKLITNPIVTIGEVQFNGQYFFVDYRCLMNYDYGQASMNINLENNNEVIGEYVVTEMKESGTIIFDPNPNEYGLTNMTIRLDFVDFVEIKHKTFTFSNIDLSYSYSFEGASIDISPIFGEIPPYVSGYIKSSYTLPNDYTINIRNDDGSINISNPISENVFVNTIPYRESTTLSISILNENGEVYLDNISVTINPVDAYMNYASPFSNCVSPYDAVVTYNDDGTINIYRDCSFVKIDNPNISFNAMIYSSVSDDSATEEKTYTNRYDCYVEDKYAIIENIPFTDYIFEYRYELMYNNVTYICEKTTPSGTIKNYTDRVKVETSVTTEKTLFSIYNDSNSLIYFIDYIKVDGVEYNFESFESNYSSEYHLTIMNEVHVNEVTLMVSDYQSNYDNLASLITLKGNRNYELVVSVIEI